VGSIPEVLVDGETGRLVQPGSAVELARAMAMALDDTRSTRRMTDAARRRVEARYSIERTAERYQRLFDEVMIA
jgi:glycosyltransferase involved in cell wall biosynthesis